MRFPPKPDAQSSDDPAATNAPYDDAPRSADAERGARPQVRGGNRRPVPPDDAASALYLPPLDNPASPSSPDFGLDDPFPSGYGGARQGSERGSGQREPAPRDPRPDRAPRDRAGRDIPPRGAAPASRDTPPREPLRRGAPPQDTPSHRMGAATRDPRDPREPRPAPRDRSDTYRADDSHAPSWGSRAPEPPRPSDSIYDRFGWRLPEGTEESQPPPPARPVNSSYWEEREERIRLEESGQMPIIAPNGPYHSYTSGVFEALPAHDATAPAPTDWPYSQQFTLPPFNPNAPAGEWSDATGMRSGAFPVVENAADSLAPPSMTRSGRFLTTRTASGPFAVVPLGQSTPPSAAPIAMEPAAPPLITDRAALAFFGLALALIGGMAAFIALRFDTFPREGIALHFGPGGARQPDRIGERQELWTIPFLALIVFVANTALAFVFDFFDRRDRFVPRLLLLGSALVAAVAWVVLLTLLNKQPIGG